MAVMLSHELTAYLPFVTKVRPIKLMESQTKFLNAFKYLDEEEMIQKI